MELCYLHSYVPIGTYFGEIDGAIKIAVISSYCRHYLQRLLNAVTITPPFFPDPELIANAISSIGNASFSSRLIALLKNSAGYDCYLMVGFSDQHKPVYLYDAVPQNRDLLFDIYLAGAYTLDPFYNAFLEGIDDGVYRLKELAPSRFMSSEYYRAFYCDTGWHNEIGILIQINKQLTVAVFMGQLEPQPENSDLIATIDQLLPILTSLCHQHWHQVEIPLSAVPADDADGRGPNLAQLVERAFQCFGDSQLTAREQEIVRLILLGHATASIAEKLFISVGTVKNHRKHIYAKLGLKSQSELFKQFLNDLILLPAKGERKHEV